MFMVSSTWLEMGQGPEARGQGRDQGARGGGQGRGQGARPGQGAGARGQRPTAIKLCP